MRDKPNWTSTQVIRWGDMDALGHVNNTVYFRYMEQARVEWLSATGFHLDGHIQTCSVVIINTSCTFLRPLTYPGNVCTELFLANPGRSSLDSLYDIRIGEELYAQGAAKMVWMDRVSGKSTPLPDSIRALFT